MNNSRVEKKERSEQEEVKETRRDNRKSSLELIAETENKVQTE